MTEALYQQIGEEIDAIQTPEEELLFNKKHIDRVNKLTPEESDAELAFLEKKALEIKAKVEKHLAEKQAKQNVVAV